MEEDFKRKLRPISLLAIGIVLLTTFAVAAGAHWGVGGLGALDPAGGDRLTRTRFAADRHLQRMRVPSGGW